MKVLKVLLAVVAVLLGGAVQANDNTLKIVASFPPGSGPDSMARKVAEQLSDQLKVPVIIESKSGGNGVVAMNYALGQKDNNVILYASNDNMVVYPLLTNNSTLINKFRPLKQALYSYLILAVSPSVKNLDALKQNKNISYGSWGVGSAPHVLGSGFGRFLGVTNSVHVPYKDYGQWFGDVSSGTLSFSFVTVGSTGSLEKSGKIKYLATASADRSPRYPNLPTLQELTGQSFYGIGWAGFYVPTGMSGVREKELKTTLDQVFGRKEVVETLDALSYNYQKLSTDQFRQFVQQDQKKFQEAFYTNNIKLD
jgi:tripartite-type tricarboxylate transporter receptor subunit TctC